MTAEKHIKLGKYLALFSFLLGTLILVIYLLLYLYLHFRELTSVQFVFCKYRKWNSRGWMNVCLVRYCQ